MTATSLYACAAPTLRKLMPAEAAAVRNLPLSLALPLYGNVLRERVITPEVFEAQFAKVLRLPLDKDPQRRQLATIFDKRPDALNRAYHAGSYTGNHAPAEFDRNFTDMINRQVAMAPNYSRMMDNMLKNYERLKKQHGIDFYPFQLPNFLVKSCAILRDIEHFHEQAQQHADEPGRDFNEKTRKYYTSLFNLSYTFLTL